MKRYKYFTQKPKAFATKLDTFQFNLFRNQDEMMPTHEQLIRHYYQEKLNLLGDPNLDLNFDWPDMSAYGGVETCFDEGARGADPPFGGSRSA